MATGSPTSPGCTPPARCLPGLGLTRVTGFEAAAATPRTLIDGVAPDGVAEGDVLSGVFYGWLNQNHATTVQVQGRQGQGRLHDVRHERVRKGPVRHAPGAPAGRLREGRHVRARHGAGARSEPQTAGPGDSRGRHGADMKLMAVVLGVCSAFAMAAWAQRPPQSAEKPIRGEGSRVFEMRTYYALPGKLDDAAGAVPRPHGQAVRETRHDQHRLLGAG